MSLIKNLENIDSMRSPVVAYTNPQKNLTAMYTSPVNRDGVWCSLYGGESLEEMVANLGENSVYTNFEIMEMDDLVELNTRQNEKLYNVGKAKPIDEERFIDLLECLPPENYVQNKKAVSFRFAECLTGSLFTYCLRTNGKFYELVNHIGTTQEELLAICNNPENILEA